MRDYISSGTLLEQLEEVGKINIDDVDVDLEALIEKLDNDYNLPCRLENLVGGCYLVNLHYEENRR